MRFFMLPYAVWLGVVQLAAPTTQVSDLPRLVAAAGVLGSLTVLVYRLGVWRQEMEHSKSTLGADVRSHREESGANFARLERRMESLERMLTDYMQFKRQASGWHQESVRRLKRLEVKSP